MYKNLFCNISLAGTSLSEFGLIIPSNFNSLTLSNSEISSMTSWTLKCNIVGDYRKQVNVAAFEALIYTAAQASSSSTGSAGIPVSFVFGWLDQYGNVEEYTSYTGFTLTFSVSVSGQFMTYELTGYATLALQSSMPVLNIPALTGMVQPSAVVEALAKAVKADTYYQLDIDHNDAVTLVNHGNLTTSFNQYVRGTYSGEDEYDEFPGLLTLSKSYNSSRSAAGLKYGYKSLSSVLNNVTVTPVDNFLKESFTDDTVQCTSFSYWVEEPTMTKSGIIHYKSNSGLLSTMMSDTLEYGTANTNVISISGSYDGVEYNLSDMSFASLGFSVDGSGNAVACGTTVVNSWSSSVADVYQTANIINDINGLATQFSADFTVQIPGSVKQYQLAQPVSLLVLSGNTISPITGIYNIMEVSHSITNTFVTTLKLQRLTISSANQVASGMGIYIVGSSGYTRSSYQTTSNVISTGKVDFGYVYPTFEDLYYL